jgi:iron only hydrogenase large subunit-like protein
MNDLSPVFTIENECLDCYKCVRECPVKAIRIFNGHASVLSSRCIACGQCISICPQNAKKVRNDIPQLERLLDSGKKIYASLAPSWPVSFSCHKEQLIKALKILGFAGVSETALGAQEVSIQTAGILKDRKRKLWISSACPAVVDYIRLYHPQFAEYIIPLASPAVTHGRMIKKEFGEDSRMVFIGPCAAKKNEADLFPDLMDIAVSFQDILKILSSRGIRLETEAGEDESFNPCRAYEGALYPMEGGMNETLRRICIPEGVRLLSVTKHSDDKEPAEGT